jgi:hypothetical protein
VLQMKFDDPEQEPPFWLATNNVVLNTPFPRIQIKALAIRDSSEIGVFISGPRTANVYGQCPNDPKILKERAKGLC